jgi:REP element-mobilizing transposase RayT
MAHSFSQNYQHIVFAVKYRNAILEPIHNDELQKYITASVIDRKSYMIAINNMPDHLHLFTD